MTIDHLLAEIRLRRLVLISESELWPSPAITQELVRALKYHRLGLALLIRWSSIDVCPSRDNHRQYWIYRHGCYVCELCERIAV